MRSALLRCVSTRDIREIGKKLVAEARTGDVAAVRLLFDRIYGPPVASDILERLEALETREP